MKSKLVSIVIPVYNEEEHLSGCLESIKKQTLKPFEVIVIDNNSTDKTASIAMKYSFVKLIHEKKQGVVFARDAGFNQAKGKIIGRIDADTIVDPDWVDNLEKTFKEDKVDAVTGSVYYYDVAYQELSFKADLFFRKDLARQMRGRKQAFLYGANMAITNEIWKKIKSKVCHQKGMHEDIDLAIHLADEGAEVFFDQRLKVGVSVRRLENGFFNFYRYLKITPYTYKIHHKRYGYKFYPIIFALMASYHYIMFNHIIYDPESKTNKLRRVWIYQPKKRVDPTLNMK